MIVSRLPYCFIVFAIVMLCVGCASIERLPAVPFTEAARSKILDAADVRVYVSDLAGINRIAYQAYQRRQSFKPASAPQIFLAISGGGDDGAFGAGLLVGWSEHGDRPVFDVVTGVSTGSLTAPFAFLGSAYDSQLKKVYTEINAANVFEARTPLISIVANDALFDSAPLRAMITQYVDDDLIRKIAEEYRKGRLLFILTTNLDQGRPVIWNIGAIAESGSPKAKELIIDVLLASASIPALFPPVMMDVSVDGKSYQEMHVDGGTIAQAFLYPPSFSIRKASARFAIKRNASRKRVAYIIRNGRLLRRDEDVKVQTLAIAKQAISTMIVSSGVNDAYRMYLTTRRDGVDFNLASVGNDFTEPYKGPFDKTYMGQLFEYGFRQASAGYHWQKTPPGYIE